MILLLTGNYLSSPFINSDSIKRKIQAAISQKIGGKVDYHSIDLSIFPHIHARVDQVTITLTGKLKGSIETLDFFPKVLPLFAGKVRISEIDIVSPDIDFTLPRDQEKRNITKEPVTLDMIKEIVQNAISPLFSELPEFQLTFEDGTGNIMVKDETVFDIKDVQAEISSLSHEIEIDIKGSSEIGEDISVKASLDRRDFKGSGVIQMVRFEPQSLIDRFLPDAPYRILEPIDNLSFRVKIEGLNDVKAEVEGSPVNLKVKRGDKGLFLKGKELKGSLQINEGETQISLTELKLEHPHLNMSGDLVVDHETRQISLELTGRDIDIDSVREEALALAGDNKVVQKIFQMVKGGRLSDMVITSEGKTLGGLGNMENLVIKGNIREGNILIPGPDFVLEDVTGDLVVEHGFVEGTNIAAKLEDGYGEEGRIRIGLKGKDAPLHIETEITAVAEQIPSLLNRLIKNRSFLSVIERVTNVRGTVAGKLVLGGRLNAINAEVDINTIDVSAHYKGVPFPLHIKEGGFHYDRENISLVSLGGTIGSSSFSELTGQISLGKDTHVEIQSGNIVTFLKEIYPWISSFEKTERSLKEVKSVSGILQISSLNLKGPLTIPKNWQTEATGEIKDLLVDTALFPEPLEVREAFFKVADKEFSLSDSTVKAGDSSLRLSGAVSHNMAGFDKADIAFHGEIGQGTMQWIENFFNLPPELSVRPPLSIQKAHMTWKKDSGISCVSNLTLQNGPDISVDMFQNPEALGIKSVHIQDAETNATFGFGLREDVIDCSFTGNLSHTTTDKIFHNTPFAKEWIKGDFQAHIQLDQPKQSTLQGTLEGKNISVPWNQKIPFNIKDISLHADGKSIRVDTHILALSDNHLSVNGEGNISEDGFLFDLDMSADELDWNVIRNSLHIEDKEEDKSVERKNEEKDVDESVGKGDEKRFWDFPVTGILRLAAESFTFDRYTWNPVQAEISFNDGGVSVTVVDANVCGVSCPGILKAGPQGLSLDFQLLSQNQDLDSTYTCFGYTKGLLTGKFDMKAHAVSEGSVEAVGRELQGSFEFAANDGRIYRFGLIASLFAFLNITEILRGKLPDVTKQGFGYKSVSINGEIQDGILTLENIFIDSPSMAITSHGDIDLIGEKTDLKVLVSPFKTVDFIVRKIPLVGKLLGGNLVSIPIGITGDIENPKISYISPTAVGKKLLGFTMSILKAPVKIITPVIPGKKREESSVIN
ncbi:MAG: hypothetical protein HND49_10865 [Planctomycetes bacterium]|nr:hypothetical protein [Planctomycetota bacterium]